MHANAAGVGVPIKNIDKLYEYANTKLANIDFNEGYYEADFVVDGNCSYLDNLIDELDSGKCYWGQGNPEPIIIVNNIHINKKNIDIIGSKNDTLKFSFNGITYIKFKASKLIEELEKYGDDLNIAIAGRSNINEWCGRRTPQILITEIEIRESNEYDF